MCVMGEPLVWWCTRCNARLEGDAANEHVLTCGNLVSEPLPPGTRVEQRGGDVHVMVPFTGGASCSVGVAREGIPQERIIAGGSGGALCWRTPGMEYRPVVDPRTPIAAHDLESGRATAFCPAMPGPVYGFHASNVETEMAVMERSECVRLRKAGAQLEALRAALPTCMTDMQSYETKAYCPRLATKGRLFVKCDRHANDEQRDLPWAGVVRELGW